MAGDTKGMARASAFFGVQPELTELHSQMLRDYPICQQRGVKLTSLRDVVLVLKDASVRVILPSCVTPVRLQLTPPATYFARVCAASA